MADTERQEKGSITTFYYAIEKGASLDPFSPDDKGLLNALRVEYPDAFLNNNKWYFSFLKQARSLLEWLGHREGSTDTSYKYARWGSNGTSDAVSSIPANKKTDIYDWVWDSFTVEQKKLFGSRPSKDSWNTTDVYLVKASKEREIMDTINHVVKDPVLFDSADAHEMELASVNRYLAYLTRNKELIGISLKETDYGDPKVTETNIKSLSEDIQVTNASITNTEGLKTWMEVIEGKGSSGVTDFKGNSLTYEAQFNIGNYIKKYKYESKVGSLDNHATEPRDLVIGASGKYTTAAARNGSVPVPKMAKIIEKYSGESINYNIPGSGQEFTNSQIQYWQNYFEEVKRDTTIKKTFGRLTIQSMGQTTTYSPEDFIAVCANMDRVQRSKTTGFPLKFRSKLRLLRYIQSFIKAKADGRLDEIIAEMYFASSKINMTDEDLSGPFIKIQ